MTRLTGSTGSGAVLSRRKVAQASRRMPRRMRTDKAGVPRLYSPSRQVPSLDAASSSSRSSGAYSTHLSTADTSIAASAAAAAAASVVKNV